MWHSRLPLVTHFLWPLRSRSYPRLFYNDHMDNLPAANSGLSCLPVVFLSISISWCCMSPSGTYIYSRELYFWNDKLEHPVPVHHPLAFQLSPWVLQNRRSFLFLRGLTPNIFVHVYQPFLFSLPSHGIQSLWYLRPFSHILGNVLDSPLLPVATIWQNHGPGEIQTFVSYLLLDSRTIGENGTTVEVLPLWLASNSRWVRHAAHQP